jgi:DNA-directed RNA polymerase subunit RPC12/RpoP
MESGLTSRGLDRMTPPGGERLGGWLTRFSCALWGHHIDNDIFRRREAATRVCRCGDAYLAADGSCTRVRHTLSCFLGHHTYVRMAERDGHHEYACIQCGHPLLFVADRDPYAAEARFKKKVRYLCGLFGHRVHEVVERNGFTEYACHCGHTFLKTDGPQDRVRHPLVCVTSGHRVRYIASRSGYSEYVCRDCGHPFCFAEREGTEDAEERFTRRNGGAEVQRRG